MDLVLLKNILLYVILPGICGLVSFFIKSILNRITRIESILNTKVDEQEVRQLLADKVEPLREDVQELKVKLDKIIDILINTGKS